MTPLECCREVDVVDAVTSRRWPRRAGQELLQHVEECAICADVAEVASALHEAHHESMRAAASLPSARSVWLRAQARARAEDSRRAARPIAVMQALGLAGATAVISLLIGAVAHWVWARADWLDTLAHAGIGGADAVGLAVRATLLAVGLWLLVAPVAVYLVASDD